VGPAEPHEVQQIQVHGLALGCGNPHYQYKLGDERIECNPNKRDLRVLVDGRLDMNEQSELAAKKANCIL